MNTTDNPQHNDPAKPDPARRGAQGAEGSPRARRSDEHAGSGAGHPGRPRRQTARARSRARRGMGTPHRPDRPALRARRRSRSRLPSRARTPNPQPNRGRSPSPRGSRPAVAADLGVRAQHHTGIADVPLRGLDELTAVTGHGCDGIRMRDALVGASAHLPARRCRHHDHTNQHQQEHQHRADGLRG